MSGNICKKFQGYNGAWESNKAFVMHSNKTGNKLTRFQTSLPLAALPFHRLITACRFRVAALSSHAALAFSMRGIAPKLIWSQLSAIYRCGQSDENIDWLVRRCLPLGLLSAASGACAVVQISPLERQCGERQASLKAALHRPIILRYGQLKLRLVKK